MTKIRNSNSTIRKMVMDADVEKENVMRYFYITALGFVKGGGGGSSYVFIKTEMNYFPSQKSLIEEVKKDNPNFFNVVILSITEFSEDDWIEFNSED